MSPVAHFSVSRSSWDDFRHGLPTVAERRQYRFAVEYFTFTSKGEFLQKTRIVADYSAGEPGDDVRWTHVRLAHGASLTGPYAPDEPQAYMEGFTQQAARTPPNDLVEALDALFTRFDQIADQYGLEKIKTVGDAYMVAAGAPESRPDHAPAIAELALRIRDHVATTTFGGRQLQMRVGVASGPVTAGIIGTHKFAYDLWGDTVNTASRMESSGLPGEIQLAPSTYELLRDTRFVWRQSHRPLE